MKKEKKRKFWDRWTGEVDGSGVAQATDILVVHVAEQLDLAERALGVDLVVEGVGDLLDGHLLRRLGVERRAGQQTMKSQIRKASQSRISRCESEVRGAGGGGPDDAVGALADGEDGGLVLGGDLEHVAEDVVLDEAAAVAERRLDVLHHPGPGRWLLLRRRRRLPPAARAGVRHLRVRGLPPAVHRRTGFGSRRGEGAGRKGKGVEVGKMQIRCCEIWVAFEAEADSF